MLDSAVEVFARHGYHRASVDDIADHAGISKPMVYLYFGSKEELFVACIRREGRRLTDMLAGAVDSDDGPRRQLAGALGAFFDFVSANRGAWSVLYRQARTQGAPFANEVQEMRSRTVALTAELLGRSVNATWPLSDPIDIAAHALVGACESLADWLIDHPEAEAGPLTDRVLDFAWPGLSTLVAGDPSPH